MKTVYIVYYTDRDTFEGMLQGVFSTKDKALKYINDIFFGDEEEMKEAEYKPNEWDIGRGAEVCILEKKVDNGR